MNKQKRTLFVSDLDGTLLNQEQYLSSYTIQTINSLIEKGMIFSFATARSAITSNKVTKGISPRIPVIIYNGAFIIENSTQKVLLSHYFTEREVLEISALLKKFHVSPIIYSIQTGKEIYSYTLNQLTEGAINFLDSRKGDPRDNPVEPDYLYAGNLFYFLCIDAADKLLPLYQLLKEKYTCIFQREIYSGDQWLEILPVSATKANAVLELKKLLLCDEVICFGDAKNDISMFRVSDACYAVQNADPELKQIATDIIGANDEDGVAKWLAAHYAL